MNYRLPIYTMLSALLCSGCTQNQPYETLPSELPSAVGTSTPDCQFDDGSTEAAPLWLCQHPTDNFTVISSAPISSTGYSQALGTAQLIAKSELSRTLSAHIQSTNIISQTNEQDSNAGHSTFTESINIKAREIMSGARVLKSVISSKNTVYILYGYRRSK